MTVLFFLSSLDSKMLLNNDMKVPVGRLFNPAVALSDNQGPSALEALSQQQAARRGQWGEAAGPFLQGNVAFSLPQQLAHLAQPGMARFPPQLLRPASWGLCAEEEAFPSTTGPTFARYD